jgi:hypothetical protein
VQFAVKLNIMKNVLLPTDLTVQSLWPIHNIVKDAKHHKLTIHVAHMLSLPTSISDLLSTRKNKPQHAIPANFTEACHMLRNKYNKAIDSIRFTFIYGNTSRYVNNFIEGYQIDAIYMLTNYTYGEPLPQSINFTSLLHKCKVPLHQLPLHNEAFSDYQILSALLYGDEQYKTPAATLLTNPLISYS